MLRSIQLLPNIITTCGLFCGFYSIVLSLSIKDAGSPLIVRSAMAILFAALFDILDGRIARITKTTTKFGKEFDSLADIVSFGIAPALLLYNCYFNRLGFVGFIVSFIYLMTGTLRLARFNITEGNLLKYSQGLVIPIPAVMIALFIIYEKTSLMLEVPPAIPMIPVSLILSYLMISNFKFRVFKDFKPSRLNITKVFTLFAVIMTLALLLNPALVFLSSLTLYIIVGVLQNTLVKDKKRQDIFLDWEELLSTFYSDDEEESVKGEELVFTAEEEERT